MKLSIIIPTFNRPREALNLIRRLTDQIDCFGLRGTAEIIFVNDGSRASAGAAIRQEVERVSQTHHVRLISHQNRRGPASARNLGVKEAKGDFLAFLDDDILPGHDFLSKLVEAHKQHPEALVINGLLTAAGNDVFSRLWLSRYAPAFNRSGSGFYVIERLASGFFSVKRDILSSFCPLFDEKLPSREDFDLAIRLKEAGIPIYKSDGITGTIQCRRSLGAFLRQQAWYARGEYSLRKKYGEEKIIQLSGPVPKQACSRDVRILKCLASAVFKVCLNYQILANERNLKAAARVLGPLFIYKSARWFARKASSVFSPVMKRFSPRR